MVPILTIDQKVPVDEVMFMHRHTVKEKGMITVTVKGLTMIGVLLRFIRPNVVMVEIYEDLREALIQKGCLAYNKDGQYAPQHKIV